MATIGRGRQFYSLVPIRPNMSLYRVPLAIPRCHWEQINCRSVSQLNIYWISIRYQASPLAMSLVGATHPNNWNSLTTNLSSDIVPLAFTTRMTGTTFNHPVEKQKRVPDKCGYCTWKNVENRKLRKSRKIDFPTQMTNTITNGHCCWLPSPTTQ